MMMHAWLAALAILLLLPTSADARKRCRPVDPPASVAEDGSEEGPTAGLHWARGNDSSWVHEGDPSWVHEQASSRWVHDGAIHEDDREPSGVDPGWVHETDYGWWAGVPEAALAELDEEPDGRATPESDDDSDQDCTISKDRNECVVLANQVALYRFRLGLAEEREDEAWAENLEATIARLESRAELYGCTWVGPSMREQIEQTVAAVIRAAGTAAQVASMFYRMGLF